MTARIAMFLPCRAGSERIPHKNTRPFAGFDGGLIELKLAQLEQASHLHTIIVDSNDPVVLAIATQRQLTWRGKAELVVRQRPDALGEATTTTDALINYALDTVDCEVLAWTHVTSPFVTASRYDAAIERFTHRDAGHHDSLMMVRRLQSFLWHAPDVTARPLNYDNSTLRWPRTQDLAPVYEVTSGLFIVPRQLGLTRRDRIGAHPILDEVEPLEAFDIDVEADFLQAERLYRVTSVT